MARIPTPGNFGHRSLDSIELKSVDYFWHNRIPVGQIVLVAGRPSGGKSTITSDIAAHVSRDLKRGVILSNHEDAESAQKARASAAGADLKLITIPDQAYRFPDDIGLLKQHILANDVQVAIFDAAAQHLIPNINADQDVRQALSPLAKLADETGCTMVFISHVVKHFAKSAHPITAVGGSGGGLPGAARSIFFVGPNPDNLTERACVWVKDQYRELPKALTFEIEAYDVEDDTTKVIALTQRLILTGDDIDIDPVSVLSGKPSKDESSPTGDKRASAAEWLTIYLSTGAKPAKDLRDDAARFGIAWATVRRGADDIGIEKYRKGFGKGSFLVWQLPDGHPALVEDYDEDEDVQGWITPDMLDPSELAALSTSLEGMFGFTPEELDRLANREAFDVKWDEDAEAGMVGARGTVEYYKSLDEAGLTFESDRPVALEAVSELSDDDFEAGLAELLGGEES